MSNNVSNGFYMRSSPKYSSRPVKIVLTIGLLSIIVGFVLLFLLGGSARWPVSLLLISGGFGQLWTVIGWRGRSNR